MVYWETAGTGPGEPPFMRDYAGIWRAADKIVYSTTLEAVSSARTRLERGFDPDSIRRMKAGADRDITVGGAELAGQAVRAGVLDELHLFVTPIVVGGGTRSLPEDAHVTLELLDERRFTNGVMYLRYRQT
jgi:dihydrofolate reductase